MSDPKSNHLVTFTTVDSGFSLRKFLGNGTYDRDASSLVTLGKRVFAIGGFRGTEVVEEFNYNDEIWCKFDKHLTVCFRDLAKLNLPIMVQF